MDSFYLSLNFKKINSFCILSPTSFSQRLSLFANSGEKPRPLNKNTLFSVLHGVDAVFLEDGDVRVVFMPCRDCAHHSTGPENFFPFPLDGPSLLQGSALDFPDLRVEAQEETALLGVGPFLGASCRPSQQNLGCF